MDRLLHFTAKVVCIWFLLLGCTAIAQQTKIKNAEINFRFVSKDVAGTIGGFVSNSSINLNQIEASTIKGSVAVATLDTDNSFRDWHLKRGKYFNEDEHPRISFESTNVTAQGNTVVVNGQLSLKGKTAPLTITFTSSGFVWTGKASLYSSDYGISIKKQREDNLVEITFRFELQ
ncbi:YceI family protein [Croceitalea dokdonensis DOKDO 023]|uniref:YceI family protein n=1 Tax=Croceitalea dokdonensis DOKDO 023 TaxID=1300341 RepID=A0A0N8H4H7_9FLAO|nr:YceI family protein [Croceitalea dokdonensis]KPM33404.1 YceI family protein [Croceitalea dokdonensis DOKDO 023]